MGDLSAVTARLATLEELEDGDLEACVGLLEAAFGGWPPQPVGVSAVEHLRWKFEVPGPLPARMHLLELDGRLVALGLYLPRVFRIHGKVELANEGVDAAVHPDLQGQGLYSRRLELKASQADQGYQFTVNFTSHRLRPRTLSGWRPEVVPGQPRSLVRARDVWRVPALRVPPERRRRGYPLVPAAIEALRTWPGLRRRASQPSGCQIRSVDQFDQRFDALFEAAASQYDFVLERGHVWLNWRYADPRAGGHEILVAERDDELLGYAVYRRSSRGGMLMDLLVAPGREDVAAALLDTALAELKDRDSVSCWASPGSAFEALAFSRGFLDVGYESEMALRTIACGPELFAPFERTDGRVHVMPGDSDLL